VTTFLLKTAAFITIIKATPDFYLYAGETNS
jgi:hypothetical protein